MTWPYKDSSGRRTTLLVASTGGHLEQMSRLHRRFVEASTPVEWATFDDQQSRSLLRGENVHFIPYIAPRDYRGALAALRPARALLRSGRFDRVISTGSGIALSFLPQAQLQGLSCHYVESAARADGPSVTGNVLSHIPGIHLYTQYPSWSNERWPYRGSLFDGYAAVEKAELVERPRRIVVTLGTMRNYGFRRAVIAVKRVLDEVAAPDAQVLWQVGFTEAGDVVDDSCAMVPFDALKESVAGADLVIAHAGIGSALMALDLGKCPVLLPRRHSSNEHIDDHQLMIAGELDRRRLAVSKDPDELTVADLRAAMARTITSVPVLDPFTLADSLHRATARLFGRGNRDAGSPARTE